MEILLDRVSVGLAQGGWFAAEGLVNGTPRDSFLDATFRITKLQTGCLRVNCLDSLDRTNLTLSIFARHMLPFQLHAISTSLNVKVTTPSSHRDPVVDLRNSMAAGGVGLLTNLWADSGDCISLWYAGTGALKADVTRTGKRQVLFLKI